MSIRVALHELAAEIERRGPGYLLSAAADGGRPHVMHLRFDVTPTSADQGPVLRAPVGRSARANVVARPAVTVLFPPLPPSSTSGEAGADRDGYSLIVDAVAVIEDDDEPEDAGAGGTGAGRGSPAIVVVTAVDAVLHRPA